jgi:citrate lyase subunit beta/citryl-CoA lyase
MQSMKPLVMRSVLMTPASRPEMVQKSVTYGADVVVLDLEDATPVAMKDQARDTVRSFLAGQPSVPVGVRVNAWSTGMLPEDLDAIVSPNLGYVRLPKTETVDDVARLSDALDALEAARSIPNGQIGIAASTESALGLSNAREIALSSSRLLSMGAGSAEDGDLHRDLGCEWTEDGIGFLYARSSILVAARAAGVPFVTEGSYARVRDLDGLRRHSQHIRALGFDGRAAIHPTQVSVINDVFSPSSERIAYYRRMREAFVQAEKDGLAAIDFEGKLVDYAMLKAADKALAIADAMEQAGRS